jgi:hypothetical protein
VFTADGVVSRTLEDGSVHRVVKMFYEPEMLVELLAGLGWSASVTSMDNGWYVGEAAPRG